MAKILVVDDSQTELHVLKTMLEKDGHEVITAEGGEQGVQAAKAAAPNLILMDVVMPGLNGFQATRELSREPSTANIPVVIITTKNQETDRVWAARQGAKAYIVKPVKEKDLLEAVKANLPG